MTILPRYFLRLFLPMFGMCLLIFAGVLMMNHFLKLFNMALMKGISPFWIAGCFARLIPFILSLAIPMAFLVAMLLTLGQLSESGEVLALRASGFSFGEITWPFLAVGAVLSVFLFYLNHKASPEGFHAFRERYLQAGRQLAKIEVEPKSFMTLGPWKLYAQEADKQSGRLGQVYIVRQDTGKQSIRISAARGSLRVEPGRGVVLALEDGAIQLPKPDPRQLANGTFKTYRVEVPLSGGPRAARSLDIPEINSTRLAERVMDPATSVQHRVEYKVELALRSAAALSPFVFFWLAAPLGIQLGRQSRARGFGLSLAVLFGFYALVAVGIGLGRRHETAAYLAPWIPDIAGLALGFWLTRRALKK